MLKLGDGVARRTEECEVRISLNKKTFEENKETLKQLLLPDWFEYVTKEAMNPSNNTVTIIQPFTINYFLVVQRFEALITLMSTKSDLIKSCNFNIDKECCLIEQLLVTLRATALKLKG